MFYNIIAIIILIIGITSLVYPKKNISISLMIIINLLFSIVVYKKLGILISAVIFTVQLIPMFVYLESSSKIKENLKHKKYDIPKIIITLLILTLCMFGLSSQLNIVFKISKLTSEKVFLPLILVLFLIISMRKRKGN